MSIVLEERHIEEEQGLPPSFQLLVRLHPSLIEPIDGDVECTQANHLFNDMIDTRMPKDGYDTNFAFVNAIPITAAFNYEGWNIGRSTTATHLIQSPYGYRKKTDFNTKIKSLLSEYFNPDGTARYAFDEDGFRVPANRIICGNAEGTLEL